MTAIFFDHLIQVDEVIAEIDAHHLDPEERDELFRLIDEILHHHILNVILNHLPKEHHQEFISRLQADPAHPDHLLYLKSKVSVDIEGEITTHAARVKTELLREIKKAKNRKNRG